MASLALVVVEAAERGRSIPPDTLDEIPPEQWEVYFDELAPLCPSRMPVIPVKQRNALRVEILPSRDPRCSRRSPDGRGLAWVMSGGDPLSYGLCALRACPRARVPSGTPGGGT
jgi:hypothetical protein